MSLDEKAWQAARERIGSVDDAVFGALVDDQGDELDLVLAVALVVEEPGEHALGGGPVEADDRSDEPAEAAGLFAGFARTGAHDAVSGMIIEHGIKRIIGFGRRVLRMRMIHIHTSAISCDHVGDVELRRVGK